MDLRPLASGTRHDGLGGRWTNESTGQGGVLDRHSTTTFAKPVDLPFVTIDALYQFSAMARRIVDLEPEDAIREGFTIPAFADQPHVGKAVDRSGILRAVSRGRKWARAYGGGGVVILADDGLEPDKELVPAAIQRLRGFRVLDRYEINPHTYDEDPKSPRAGLPSIYRVILGGRTSVNVHHSRVLTFQGLDLPDRLLVPRMGWGGSVIDLIWQELRNYSSTIDYVAEAVTLLTQGVWKNKTLADAISAGDQEAAVARFEALRIGIGMLGDIVLDKDTEDYELHERTLTGLKDAIEALVAALVAATGIPRVLLLGETPGGLNTGEEAGQIRAWYDHVAALQREIYTDPVLHLLRLYLSSREGPTRGVVPDDLEIVWRPLWQPTETEVVAQQLSRAQRRVADVSAQIVSPEEARRDPDVAKIYGVVEIPPDVEPDDVVEGGGETAASELTGVTPSPLHLVPEGEALMSARAIAARLGVGPGTIHAWARDGAYPAFRVRGRWRFARSLVEAAIGGIPAAAE
jgi:hypothetical protein